MSTKRLRSTLKILSVSLSWWVKCFRNGRMRKSSWKQPVVVGMSLVVDQRLTSRNWSQTLVKIVIPANSFSYLKHQGILNHLKACHVDRNSIKTKIIPEGKELDIPENFKIACGARIEKNKLDCASYHELVDSPFIASSNIKELTYVSRGIQFHIWVQGEPTWNESQLLEDFKKFSDFQFQQHAGLL